MVAKHRIAIYSQDGLGLGHLRRNTVISQHLLETDKDATILLITDSPVAPFFKLPHGMDFIKLPSIHKPAPGRWEPTHLGVSGLNLLQLRTNILCSTFVSYRPDLLLVDHMPAGANGELLPAIEALKQAHSGCRVVLGLRDILDARKVIKTRWELDGAYDVLRHHFDRVLIYGSSHVFDTARVYDLPAPPGGIHYCGYVANAGPVQPKEKIRRSLGVDGQRLVFVSAGGGADSQFLMRSYLRAVRLLGARADFTTLMAVGVNAPASIYRELEEEASGLPVRLIRHVEDSLSHLAAADMVVCMAGYNTLSEVLHLRDKALVVPRSGPSAEQRIRAGLFARRGLIDALDPSDVSPESLAQRLLADLQRNDYPASDRTFETQGARRASNHLLELIQ
ncbi:MAG: hypothetical protein HY234_06490 [Acidobacteria bacterium]|nr:hypothetical protein [Acidobacteriota bacterium]MBI3662682.1 hypothetical protein [Acidobacteriota bacterium]